MATDEPRFITHLTPIDVTGVRDAGMQSLIILAASLGWNVHKKHNQPVVITARDRTQKRLATNTSIRMGVFQSALSTIMAHTDIDVIPTTELIDAIIAATKPPADHQRRLRLAVGETPAQHRERVAAYEAEPKGPREPEPLTTRIDEVLDAHFREVLEEAPRVSATRVAAEGEHGELVSREPFMAKRQGSAGSKYEKHYESSTSFERKWSDGYVDYECQTCGKAYTTPKGVGGHSQVHDQNRAQPAWKRAPLTKTKRVPKEVAPVIEPTTYAELVTKIMDLVLPEAQARHDVEIKALQEENQQLRERLAEIEGEFDAFIELASSRRKRAD